ncbi:hypothetical protein HETIRDRAFT_436412 [Heterobasidion irregulare TC 32-1]|uniref:Uncharacterized protein n=1 Tax=Heterobasidion irregulare (strain TC 32-1) TaxID=747525 RepID=W4JS73_HETIT|nr:uncharacterized protein HETIRDRAFT_436412 [Heterobasidion irregulare TC 32-1]ETW76294.1 hypothetical protein HETIRDRAFT_436412 [Heterobasidion irregulare TC 32-1]
MGRIVCRSDFRYEKQFEQHDTRAQSRVCGTSSYCDCHFDDCILGVPNGFQKGRFSPYLVYACSDHLLTTVSPALVTRLYLRMAHIDVESALPSGQSLSNAQVLLRYLLPDHLTSMR